MQMTAGTTFKHPWIRNHADNKPTSCIVTQTRDGVIYFREYRPDRTLSSRTEEMNEAIFQTHFVLRNVLGADEQ